MLSRANFFSGVIISTSLADVNEHRLDARLMLMTCAAAAAVGEQMDNTLSLKNIAKSSIDTCDACCNGGCSMLLTDFRAPVDRFYSRPPLSARKS